jgi:5-methylcytosine-specific restriction endonuclease McrA
MGQYRLTAGGNLAPLHAPRPRDPRTSRRHQQARLEAIRRQPWCSRCGARHDLQLDHRTPLDAGGAPFDPANHDVLCGPCNRAKSNAA